MQLCLGHVAHVNAVNRHAALGHIVEARDQVEQRRFAAARGTDDGRCLAGSGREADVLERVLVGAGIAEADVMERHNAVGAVRGQCLGRSGVMDGRGGLDDLVNAVRSHTGTGQHDGDHREHEERHDDLHRVGDERDHLTHLHAAQIHRLAAEPDDEQARAVHDERHKRHHGDHRAVGEQLGLHQVGVGPVKALFLKFLAAERADGHNAGQDFAADKVQPVHQNLHLLEFRHGYVHQNGDERQQCGHGHKDDPFQPRVAAGNVHNAADAQNGRVGYHAQQDHADELHLLDVVRGAGNQRSSGEFFDFGVGVADDGPEHVAAQVTANGGGDAGRDKADGDGHGNHEQR